LEAIVDLADHVELTDTTHTTHKHTHTHRDTDRQDTQTQTFSWTIAWHTAGFHWSVGRIFYVPKCEEKFYPQYYWVEFLPFSIPYFHHGQAREENRTVLTCPE
jgi:hypothetical protein